MKYLPIYLIFVFFTLSSCSNKDEAIDLVKVFFNTLSDTTYAAPRDYYPLYDSLNIDAKSDIVTIDESDILKQNDTLIVKCFNEYTTSYGTFKQDSIILFLIKNKANKLYICESRGLVTVDNDIKQFGKAVGAFSNKVYNDYELSECIKVVKKMLLAEYNDVQLMLLLNVRIKNWSWETGYDGEAHGEGLVVNNLDFPIENIKYKLTYYDYKGDFMARDEGNIPKILYPREKYNFSFWSSNAKYPDKANIRLEFSDKLIEDIVKNKTYKGNEYNEYLKSLEGKKITITRTH